MLPFIDLNQQQQRIRQTIDTRIAGVLSRGDYIMGQDVAELEQALSTRLGGMQVISCSSGTDALILAMLGLGVRPGDGVIVPSFTFAASAESIAVLGASPVFAEIEAESFNLSPAHLGDALAAGRAAGLRMVGIMAVGLFGQPAALDQIASFASDEGLWLLDDAAQSFGASLHGRAVGTFGRASATSFFPAKPLGCYGDGGAVFTDDAGIAEIVRSCRVHGQGEDRYQNLRIGMTGRLDTLQAAILLAKLEIFDDELLLRDKVARGYTSRLVALGNKIKPPRVRAGATSSWAQYVICLPDAVDRSLVQAHLREADIPTAIYYPRPMHHQPPYRAYPISVGGLEITEHLAQTVLALPMHPYLDEAVLDYIVHNLAEAVG